ncbi:hypothetical protein [Salinarimonas ramus]|uniref:Uncharacterized protein n=1 Tax=Salinarimonas ramus TaxID=690164 RepID=A0A917V4H7_9HYPH|nr:hypothetical protein [Salinarimonas ramus]GGK36089.1 hypothetical protein GCM10011322_23850 [Salinarimonas ramus]
MAGISLSVEGDKIQLSFQKDDQSTAIVMDAGAARTLASALTQLLDVMDEDLDEDELEDAFTDEELTEELARQLAEEDGEDVPDTIEGEVVDVTSPTIDIGLDQEGHAVVALRAGRLPPIMLRLQDDEARHISQSLAEILGAPRDVRLSQGGH